jgi:tetratricopeptide (TPR) repeat protein
MPMLTFYYLAALAVGYFSGYALLVYGKPPAKAWQRPSPAIQLLNRAVIGLVFLSAIGVIAGLGYRNLPRLRAENSDLLRQYTWLMRDSLPDTPAIILSDNPYQLYLLQASLGRTSPQNDHLLVDTSSLQNPHYQRHLHSTRPERWSVQLQAAPDAARIEQLIVLTNIIDLAASNDLYYLHPSFGYFFEFFRLESRGGVYRMRTFETNSILAPPPDSALIETNQQFWDAAREPMELTLSHQGLGSIDAGWLGTNFSRSLNFWGVELQRANRIEEAAACFELAGRLNTNNVVAHINRDYNANLQRGSTAPINPDASLESKFSRFRTWESVLAVNGPFDEPDFCLELGKIFARGNNYRQALQQFHRALDLKPGSLAIKMWIAFT